jgi:hypothetical protein
MIQLYSQATFDRNHIIFVILGDRLDLFLTTGSTDRI